MHPCDKKLVTRMLNKTTNHTIWVIPTQTCVKEQSWGVKLWGQEAKGWTQTESLGLGKFAMVNESESSLDGSSLYKAKTVLIRLTKNVRGRAKALHVSFAEWSCPSGL